MIYHAAHSLTPFYQCAVSALAQHVQKHMELQLHTVHCTV